MRKMYWTDIGTSKIQCANTDGSDVKDLVVTGLRMPNSIALDEEEGKMYWTDAGASKIQRANTDGSAIEDLVTTDVYLPGGMTVHTKKKKNILDRRSLGRDRGVQSSTCGPGWLSCRNPRFHQNEYSQRYRLRSGHG